LDLTWTASSDAVGRKPLISKFGRPSARNAYGR